MRGNAAAFDRSFARSIAWTGFAKWGGQLVSWASTIFVARMLTPADYGIVAMANIFIGLTAMLSEFGIGSAVVALPTLSGRQLRQLNAFALLLGCACFALACAVSVPLSRFFDTPELVTVTIVLSTAFIFGGLTSVPDALLQKHHRFGRLASLDIVQSVTLAATALFLAYKGFGYWTLVISAVVGRATSATLAMWAKPVGFARPRVAEIKESLVLGSHLVVSRLSWFAYSNADFLIAGKLLGKTALGFYTMAWDIASAPVGKITSLLMRVTPAYFAALRDDPTELRRYLLMTTGSLSILTFPAAFGLFLVAPDLVLVTLGEKWSGAVVPMRIIALYASLRSVTPLVTTMLASIGETRLTMRNSILAAFVLPCAFAIGSRWGVAGIAAAWIAAHPLVLLPLYRRLFARIDLNWRQYVAAMRPAISACSCMIGILILFQYVVPQSVPALGRLILEIAVGAAVYTGCLLLFFREKLSAVTRTLRNNG